MASYFRLSAARRQIRVAENKEQQAYREAVQAFKSFGEAPGGPIGDVSSPIICIREQDREAFEAAGIDTSHLVPYGDGTLRSPDA